jgi:shikimate kinase
MTKLIRQSTLVAGALALLAGGGCSREPKSWIPVMEETSTAFLVTEAETIATRVRSASAQLPADPEAAAADLAKAQNGLDHLLAYYLPLLEARERAYNAYRHFYLGRTEQTLAELDEVEAILMRVAEADQGRLVREMEVPLEKIEDARVALGGNAQEATEALQALATRLTFLLLRGGLVLGD